MTHIRPPDYQAVRPEPPLVAVAVRHDEEPVAAVAVAPIIQLDLKEVSYLKSACIKKHEENNKTVKTLLQTAATVIGIWSGLMIGGFVGIFWGIIIGCITHYAALNLHSALGTRDYLDVAEALSLSGFRTFIAKKGFELSIESIRDVHLMYKRHIGKQLADAVK